MELTELRIDSVTSVAVKGRIDIVSAPSLAQRLSVLLAAGNKRLVVDMREVVYISSAGFRTLLIASKLSGEIGGKFALCHLGAEVRRLFKIAALTEFFQIYPDREKAIMALKT